MLLATAVRHNQGFGIKSVAHVTQACTGMDLDVMSLARGGVAIQDGRFLFEGYRSQGVNIRVDIYIPYFNQAIGRLGLHRQ